MRAGVRELCCDFVTLLMRTGRFHCDWLQRNNSCLQATDTFRRKPRSNPGIANLLPLAPIRGVRMALARQELANVGGKNPQR